jgi:hypothetical protein
MVIRQVIQIAATTALSCPAAARYALDREGGLRDIVAAMVRLRSPLALSRPA